MLERGMTRKSSKSDKRRLKNLCRALCHITLSIITFILTPFSVSILSALLCYLYPLQPQRCVVANLCAARIHLQQHPAEYICSILPGDRAAV